MNEKKNLKVILSSFHACAQPGGAVQRLIEKKGKTKWMIKKNNKKPALKMAKIKSEWLNVTGCVWVDIYIEIANEILQQMSSQLLNTGVEDLMTCSFYA